MTKIKKHSFLYNISRYKGLYLMVLPAILFYIIFRYASMFGLLIAFQDYKPMLGKSFFETIFQTDFIGLHWFKFFFSSPDGPQVLMNTISISVYKIIFGFPAPIILALMLNEIKNAAFKKTIQTITYLPHFLSWVILAGILRIIFSPDYGAILPFFDFFNMETINFLGDSRYFRALLVISDIWQNVGWGSIIYLAALSSLDVTLYEAAKIDGANRWHQLWFITLPSISGTIMIMFILRIGQVFDAGFDQIFNLYNPAVYRVADIIDTFVYRNGLISQQYSYTSAIGLFKSVISFALVMITNTVAKRLGYDSVI